MAEPALLRDSPERDIVVVGASAGGVEALATIAALLPEDFPGAVFAVIHMPDMARSSLPEILDRSGPLPVVAAQDGEPVEPGKIFVAPPGCHLLLQPGRMRLFGGPKVNAYRPSVDVLFRTAARAYGSRVIGVVLSGALSDGTFGLRAIKRRGGAAIAQSDAVHQGMPTSAISEVDVDCVVPLREIPGALTMLMATREENSMDFGREGEGELEAGFDLASDPDAQGEASGFMCPECGGALWETDDEGLRGYFCHVGHSFSADSMLEEHGESVERALWGAVRILEERKALVLRLAERMEGGGHMKSAQGFSATAREAGDHADVIRRLIEEPPVAKSQHAGDEERGRAA